MLKFYFKMNKVTFIFIAFWTCFAVLSGAGAVSVEEDLTLTSKQKFALEDFKKIVRGRLPHHYMYEDLYLIRWLRARNFNLKEAEKMLIKSLKWREENGMDEIVHQPWRAEMRKQYKFYIDGQDKDGRPIAFADAGDWDIRKGIVSGQEQLLHRFRDSIFEEAGLVLRKLIIEEKQNVTQFYVIIDAEGFNLVQTGCPRCIPILLGLVTTYENYYPGYVHKIVMLNTPEILHPIIQLAKNLMTKPTRDIFYVYGRTGSKANLLNDIDSDQLFYELGGTRELPY